MYQLVGSSLRDSYYVVINACKSFAGSKTCCLKKLALHILAKILTELCPIEVQQIIGLLQLGLL